MNTDTGTLTDDPVAEKTTWEVIDLELTGKSIGQIARFTLRIYEEHGYFAVKDCVLIRQPEGKLWMSRPR